MTKELDELLARARDVPMTPEEEEAQRRSFAYGNTRFENDRITRTLVDEVASELGDDEKDGHPTR